MPEVSPQATTWCSKLLAGMTLRLLLPPNDRTRSWVCTSSDELSRGTITERFVRVNLVVVGDPARQLAEDALGVGSRAHPARSLHTPRFSGAAPADGGRGREGEL